MTGSGRRNRSAALEACAHRTLGRTTSKPSEVVFMLVPGPNLQQRPELSRRGLIDNEEGLGSVISRPIAVFRQRCRRSLGRSPDASVACAACAACAAHAADACAACAASAAAKATAGPAAPAANPAANARPIRSVSAILGRTVLRPRRILIAAAGREQAGY